VSTPSPRRIVSISEKNAVFSDGTQRELRAILDWLDTAGIEADELSVHTPDLDDVFFALTGSADVPAQTNGSTEPTEKETAR